MFKRLLALCAALALCLPALAETYNVTYNGTDESESFSLLLRDDGTALTREGEYGYIYAITPDDTPEADRLYSASPARLSEFVDAKTVQEDDYYLTPEALLDAEGRMLTAFEYSSFSFSGGYVIFRTLGDEGKVGAMDSLGNIVIEAAYESLCPVGGKRWLALVREDDERCAVVRIDKDGSVHETGLHTYYPEDFGGGDDLWAVWDVIEYGDRAVYINAMGEVQFGRGFDYGTPFENGYAVVRVNESYGVIDKSGSFAVPDDCDDITHETGGPYILERGSTVILLDPVTLEELARETFPEGEHVYETQMGDQLIFMIGDTRVAIYTTAGAFVSSYDANRDINYYQPDVHSEVTRLVETTGDWPFNLAHLVDLQGNQVGEDFQGLNAGIWQDGKGRFVCWSYKVQTNGIGDYGIDWNSYRYGIVDEDGNPVLPMIYNNIDILSPDRYWVTQGNLTGMIDSQGKWYYTINDYMTLMD